MTGALFIVAGFGGTLILGAALSIGFLQRPKPRLVDPFEDELAQLAQDNVRMRRSV